MDNINQDFPITHGLLEATIVNPADSATINHALINDHRITRQFDYSSEDQHLREHLEMNNSKAQQKYNGIKNEIEKTYIENNLDFYCNHNEIFAEERNGLFYKTDKEASEKEFNHLASKQPFEENLDPLNPEKNEKDIDINGNSGDADESNKMENDEEEIDEEDDLEFEGKTKTVSSRSARGLRVLSVRVHEIVREKKQSTYKEVADDLINELSNSGRLDSENMKQGKESTKEEKNVRRRVYDALNVLIAAGILKKDGKKVFYDLQHKPHVPNAYKMNDKEKELFQIQEEIKNQEEILKAKKKEYLEIKDKRNCLSKLVERNKADEIIEKFNERHNKLTKIHLPFFALRTSNNPNNIAQINR